MLITVIVGVLAMLISLAALWYSRSDRAMEKKAKRLADQIAAAITSAFKPFDTRLGLVEAKTGPDAQEFQRLLIRGMITDSLGPLDKQISSLETKVELFWGSLATEMAKILHQPDPLRHHIDRLLESFMEGTLSNDERVELRKHLVYIRNWEQGQPSEYPIHPGEQVAAAILLKTMDISDKA